MSADATYTNHEMELERTKAANDHEYQRANTLLCQSLAGYTTSETRNLGKLNEAQREITLHMKSCGDAMMTLHGKSPDLHDVVAKELREHEHGRGVCKILQRVAESFVKVGECQRLATSLKARDDAVKLDIVTKRNELSRLKADHEAMVASYDKQKKAHSEIVTRACAYDTFLQNLGNSQALESSLGVRLSRSVSVEDATASAEPVPKRTNNITDRADDTDDTQIVSDDDTQINTLSLLEDDDDTQINEDIAELSLA